MRGYGNGRRQNSPRNDWSDDWAGPPQNNGRAADRGQRQFQRTPGGGPHAYAKYSNDGSKEFVFRCPPSDSRRRNGHGYQIRGRSLKDENLMLREKVAGLEAAMVEKENQCKEMKKLAIFNRTKLEEADKRVATIMQEAMTTTFARVDDMRKQMQAENKAQLEWLAKQMKDMSHNAREENLRGEGVPFEAPVNGSTEKGDGGNNNPPLNEKGKRAPPVNPHLLFDAGGNNNPPQNDDGRSPPVNPNKRSPPPDLHIPAPPAPPADHIPPPPAPPADHNVGREKSPGPPSPPPPAPASFGPHVFFRPPPAPPAPPADHNGFVVPPAPPSFGQHVFFRPPGIHIPPAPPADQNGFVVPPAPSPPYESVEHW